MTTTHREVPNQLYGDVFWDGRIARAIVRKRTRWALTWHPQCDADIVLQKEFNSPQSACD